MENTGALRLRILVQKEFEPIVWVRATVWCLRWNHWGALKHWNQACFRVVNHGIVKQKLTLARIIMMLCKICCSPRFVACFCGDFVKQIEIGQSQKVAKKLNELHACYWILARTIYDAVSHSWRNPMTYSCHFFACEYFCTSKWVPLFHLFSRNINVKNMNATIEKLKPSIHMIYF